MILSIDPRTGEVADEVAEETALGELDHICEEAAAATEDLVSLGREGRALMLEAMADALEASRDELVALADRETALGAPRLNGELTRTGFQLRFFADVLRDGAYLEATIDHAGETAMGPRPDLRRMLVPVGVVGVFGASNFPFAFSVPGGDTASALAAGCPVVVKAHDAHPATSLASAAALRAGARQSGAPEGAVGLVFGEAAGVALVEHRLVRAIGFTGSLHGGRFLADKAAARPSPIPFYGELGALNAVVVCPDAAHEASSEIGAGLAASFTLGTGQFCTKPGLVLVPVGADGDRLVEALRVAVAGSADAAMLSGRIAEAFSSGVERLERHRGVRLLASGSTSASRGFAGTPSLFEASPDALDGPALEECFGPVLVVVRYRDPVELAELIARLRPALTASIHATDTDAQVALPLAARLQDLAGRVVWNGYPTGVAVAWAMHHGGPYPATTDPLHSSVGASAIRRFLRPVAFQNAPSWALPPELADSPPEGHRVPRRIDGRIVLP